MLTSVMHSAFSPSQLLLLSHAEPTGASSSPWFPLPTLLPALPLSPPSLSEPPSPSSPLPAEPPPPPLPAMSAPLEKSSSPERPPQADALEANSKQLNQRRRWDMRSS